MILRTYVVYVHPATGIIIMQSETRIYMLWAFPIPIFSLCMFVRMQTTSEPDGMKVVRHAGVDEARDGQNVALK